MAPGKRLAGKEELAEHSLATVKSLETASRPFNGAAQRWGESAHRTASQILENHMVSCGLLLAGAPILPNQNTLLLEYEP